MNIRFFGDSWFWTWYYKNSFKSKTIKKWAATTGFDHHDALPTLSVILNELGHNVISYNKPGDNFYDTVDKVCSLVFHKDIKYNVVFFSNLFRYKEQLRSFNVHNYDKFMKKWNEDIIILLERLQKWAELYNQEIILVGGQCTLSNEIFNQLVNKKGIHLLSECLTNQILQEYYPNNDACKILDGRKFGIFKLPEFYPWITDKWDQRLVDHIYEDSKLWNEIIVAYNVYCPDSQHPTVTGQIFFLDLLLQKIEILEGEKN